MTTSTITDVRTIAIVRSRGAAVGEVVRWDGVPPMYELDDPDGNRSYIVEPPAQATS